MIAITGSSAHRAWRCPASAVLPQDTDDHQEESSEPARDKGKDIHRYLERVGAAGREQALGEAPAELQTLLGALDIDNIPVGLSTEVAFARNWRTFEARVLKLPYPRAYDLADPPLSADEQGMTFDLVGIEQREALRGYLGDYKSGHGKYPAPDKFAQTLLGASCVRSVWGAVEMVLELLHIHDDGTHHVVRRTVDEWEIDAFDEDYRAAMELIEDEALGVVAVHEGDHCKYCPAYKHCPGKVALIRSIPGELLAMGVGGPPEALVVNPQAITVRNAGDAYLMAERLIDVLKRVKAEAGKIAYSQVEPIPLADGRVLGPVATSRRELDGKIAAQVLEQRYGRETAMRALDISVSIDSVREAVVANMKPKEKIQTRKGDGQLDLVIAEIANRGGVATKNSEKISAYVPKKKP